MRTISSDPAIQRHYEDCLAGGLSESLAEMFSLGQAPGAFTDTAFMAGRGDGFDRDEDSRQNALAEAKSAGVDVSGATYLPGLATYPGDPRAWVRSRGEVRARAESLGLYVEGPGFKVNGQLLAQPEESGFRDPAPDIVQDAVESRLAQNPELAHQKDLVAETKDLITPKKSRPAPFKLQRTS